ncbi:hypothetical protein EVAR_83469_1 [Eumeta japonica]|uniref:Uncharacterized protein n=1 Tax=Eumeta variegata TaxID=151549 RepID=A0A4C1ZGD5_EUMVA|nr:hypothetical protein EVAR_83469_1 [Eumeta japonica]
MFRTDRSVILHYCYLATRAPSSGSWLGLRGATPGIQFRNAVSQCHSVQCRKRRTVASDAVFIGRDKLEQHPCNTQPTISVKCEQAATVARSTRCGASFRYRRVLGDDGCRLGAPHDPLSWSALGGVAYDVRLDISYRAFLCTWLACDGPQASETLRSLFAASHFSLIFNFTNSPQSGLEFLLPPFSIGMEALHWSAILFKKLTTSQVRASLF